VSSYITTYKKLHFNPIDPNENDIVIEDIAHALSLMTRANGHFPTFYSVAQHSIACCKEAIARNFGKRLVMACLLHDAAEAYLADVTRPIKKHLPFFIEVEDKLLATIYKKFLGGDLTKNEYAIVFEVDDAMLYQEFLFYMNEKIDTPHVSIVSSPRFRFIQFEDVEKEFLHIFNELKGSV
jgi:5'-deoxynucleotidase YfbR-like HD superfamily hydrolase